MFGHMRADIQATLEEIVSGGLYKEERVLGNIFQEPIEAIWHGERYRAFRQAFESDHPARHCRT